MTTLTYTPNTPVLPARLVPCTARCPGLLTHLNGLAEDDEWHCDLPEGHHSDCRAPDGTCW